MTAILTSTRASGRLAGGLSRLNGGLVAVAVITLLAVLGPLVAPHTATEAAGVPFTPPGASALFGTDDVGHDVFSRVLYGLRLSWLSALAVVGVGMLIGLVAGVLAGLGPRWLDELLMRITDGFLAMPGALVAIAVVAAIGPSLEHTLIGVSVVWWPYYARIVRGEVRAIRSRPHVEAARLSGIGRLRVATHHVLPGTWSSLVVAASLDLGYVVLTLAGLSFLGLGAPPPAPELGAMATQGLSSILTAWWIPVFPGIGVAVLTFAANLSGDRLQAQSGRI